MQGWVDLVELIEIGWGWMTYNLVSSGTLNLNWVNHLRVLLQVVLVFLLSIASLIIYFIDSSWVERHRCLSSHWTERLCRCAIYLGTTAVLAQSLWRRGALRGQGVSRGDWKNLSVICINMQFLTWNQHIITKLSPQVFSYTYQKFHLGEGADFWLGKGACLPLSPLRTAPVWTHDSEPKI